MDVKSGTLNVPRNIKKDSSRLNALRVLWNEFGRGGPDDENGDAFIAVCDDNPRLAPFKSYLINRFPRGKVFGGSSSINHVIYTRGNRKDFDRWASDYGAEGWSYADVLPDFMAIETSYLGIENGFSRVQNNVKKGERWSSSKAFIPDEVRRRKNLDVGLHAHVTKINVIADLPVGENLYDHVTVNGIAATSVENIQINYYSPSALFNYALFGSGPFSHAYGVECLAFLSTPDADPTLPNIQFLLVNLNPTTVEAGYLAAKVGVSEIYETYYKQKQGHNAFMVVPILLHPKSSGFIRLKSADPEEYPIIDPKFLTNAADLDALVQGSKIAVQTLTTQAMRNGNVTIWDVALPACESAGPVWSESYLRCFVQHTSLSGWHPCCTAPMGTHPKAVLDARLR
ncbi:hypothetical protein MTO96_020049 [Rhipicephalus appendiculatus]